MTKQQLIDRLNEIPGDYEVTILDGFNGGGHPRKINLGPFVFSGIPDFKGDTMADYSDIDTPSGEPIIYMGYGCY